MYTVPFCSQDGQQPDMRTRRERIVRALIWSSLRQKVLGKSNNLILVGWATLLTDEQLGLIELGALLDGWNYILVNYETRRASSITIPIHFHLLPFPSRVSMLNGAGPVWLGWNRFNVENTV